MEKKKLKQILAGLGVAGLISAGGLTTPGCATSASGWGGDKEGAGSTEKKVEEHVGSGWGGSKDSAGGADEEANGDKESGGSGWGGSK